MEFEGQREGEEVIYVFRRHIMTSIKGFLWLVVLTGVGLIPMFIWPGNGQMFFVWLIFLGVGILGAAYSWMLWYFSYYIVTDERLRQTRQKGLFKKSVVDLELSSIQNMSFGVNGVFATMFDYGSILIQTEAGDLVISMVSHPETVYNELENTWHDKR
ncbi:PH domain-containing protein [Candidatus Saccharibacteria bacterium]|jgi:predicted membrane protein|nr:PH domain-containing protein [Candidatus Saccharibacteria bacterium]